ncbi:hypothetical protein HK099_002962 [Clydaea vesicula]|uniref:Protein FAM184A/B N-terminal domain-containing protein n=1 Tax=Clydaea vesicula TaxID=447962 RepID=A0AAD5Y155_9FUNG|nr:hypothetical protein HK099_002962 [Clydaea vesicula]
MSKKSAGGEIQKAQSLKSVNKYDGSISSETSYKMCKKIAQLTKVVYYLNTKNEDHSTEIKSLISAYEDEINNIYADGNSKIEEANQIAAQKDIELRAHEDVIKSYLDSIAGYEKSAKEDKVANDHLHAKISKLEEFLQKKNEQISDLEQNKNELNSTISTARAYSERDLSVKQEIIDNLSSNASQEMQILKKSYEEKILELETKIAFDAVEHAKEISTREDLLKDTSSLMRKRQEEDAKYFQAESKRLKLAAAEQEKRHSENVKEIENKYIEALEHEGKKQSLLEGKYQALNEELNSKQELLESQKLSTIEKITECNVLKANISTQMDKYVELEKSFYDKSAKLMRTEMLTEQLEGKLMKKNMEYEELDGNYNQLNFDHISLNADYRDLQEKLVEAKGAISEQTQIITNLNKTKEELEFCQSSNEKEIIDLKVQMQDLIVSSANKLASSLATLKAELESKNQLTLMEATETLINKYEKEIAEKLKIIDELKNTIISLKERHDQKFGDLKEELDTIKKKYHEKVKEMDKEIVQLNGQVDTLSNNLKECHTDNTRLKINLEKARSEAEQMELDRSHLYQKMVSIDEQIRTELDAKFRQDMLLAQEEWRIKHEQVILQVTESMHIAQNNEKQLIISKMTDEKIKEIEIITQEYLNKMELSANEKKEIEKSLAASEDSMKVLMAKNSQMQIDHLKEMKLLQESEKSFQLQQKKKMETEFNANLTQMKVSAAISLSNLEKKHAKFVEELKVLHEGEVGELKIGHEHQIEVTKKEFEVLKNNEIEQIRVEQLYKDRKAQEEFNKRLEVRESELTIKWMENIKYIKTKNNEEFVKQQELVEKLTADLELANENYDKFQKLYESEIVTNDALKIDIKGVELSLEMLKQSSKQILKEHEESFIKKSQMEAEELNNAHLEDSQKMLQDFEKAQNFLKAQIQNQTKLLQEADLKYKNREPRQVDAKKICELEEELKVKKTKIKELKEEVQFYKLELNNREANFNKIFNKSPFVGVMPVLSKVRLEIELFTHYCIEKIAIK